jgi:histidinol-phosphatase (PHP family)
MYITDYHTHTIFSDGREVPEAYIDKAIEARLSEIGFSEHLSLFSKNQDCCMDPDNVNNYIAYIKNLKNRYSEIFVRTGLEIDFFPGREKEISEFLDPLELDYRIGSLHYLGEDTVDFAPDFYEGKNIDRLYEIYFENLILAIESGIFDIIGHCDLIRIFGFKPTFSPEPFYRKIASSLRKYDIAFELNTNGRNKPIGDFYPDRRFIHIFSEEKVVVCVNSDAHFPARVAQYFEEAYDLLRKTGFKEMATYSQRKRIMKPL